MELPKVYRVKVTLAETDPPVWRRLLIPADHNLGDLHHALQAVMPWQDYHLHQFLVGKKIYGDPESDDFGSVTLDECRMDLRSLVRKKIRKFHYEYDFGDGWEHLIEIEKVLPWDENTELPYCLEGARACPPEDSGGPWGYSEKVSILKDPKHPQHEELKEWMGDFDPEKFDLASANARLHGSYEMDDHDVGETLLDIFQGTCSWCHREIEPEQEVYGQGIKLQAEFVESHEGKVVPMDLVGCEEPKLCLIPRRDSPSRQAGTEGFFHLCSKKCTNEIRKALQKTLSIAIGVELRQ